MELILLRYHTGATLHQYYFNTLSVKGFDTPEEWELVPALQTETLNGTIAERIAGYRRVMTIDFGVIGDPLQRARLFAFVRNPERSVTIAGGTIAVAVEEFGSYEAEWLGGTQEGRRYVLRLKERTAQTIKGFPGFASTYL